LCLRVDSSSDATFSFSIEQSIEGMKGRIADVKTASPHAFARLDGTLTLTRVCAAGGVEGGSVVEGKVRDVRVRCDESLTPDVQLRECANFTSSALARQPPFPAHTDPPGAVLYPDSLPHVRSPLYLGCINNLTPSPPSFTSPRACPLVLFPSPRTRAAIPGRRMPSHDM
jgi:hypothetical protein